MNIKLKPRQLSLICAMTIFVMILNGFLETDFEIINILMTIAGFAISAFWIIFLVGESKYRKTLFGRLTYISISVIIVGFLFKLQHWPFAGTTLMIGYVGIMVIYASRFFTKKQKHLLDILKLLWVETTAVISLLVLMHKIDREYYIINSVVFIVLICVFTLDYNKRRSIIR